MCCSHCVLLALCAALAGGGPALLDLQGVEHGHRGPGVPQGRAPAGQALRPRQQPAQGAAHRRREPCPSVLFVRARVKSPCAGTACKCTVHKCFDTGHRGRLSGGAVDTAAWRRTWVYREAARCNRQQQYNSSWLAISSRALTKFTPYSRHLRSLSISNLREHCKPHDEHTRTSGKGCGVVHR